MGLELRVVTLLAAGALGLGTPLVRGAGGNVQTIPNWSQSWPNDVNDFGLIVGTYLREDGRHRPFALTVGGALEDLGTLSGASSGGAGAVNEAGSVTGASTIAGRDSAFIRSSAGVMEQALSVGTYSQGMAINNLGDIAGSIGVGTVFNPDDRAFIRLADGTVHILDATEEKYGAALGINDSRVTVGYFNTTTSKQTAFMRNANGTIETLSFTGATGGAAYDINNAGQIVGSARTVEGAYRAFLRDPADGVMRNLGTIPGGKGSGAVGISENGIACGYVQLADGTTHAACWSPEGQLVDVDAWLDQVNPDFGAFWTLRRAEAINSSGMIIGTGVYNDGPDGLWDGLRGFVLDASTIFVPEPAGICALLLLAPLALRRRT